MQLSVVVCTYNRVDMLSRAIDSLCHQTLDPALFEIVVVDNNSTDATADCVVDYQRRFPSIRFFREPCQGLAFARNHGWQVAMGNYVAYLDDDAWASEDWCERMVAAFLDTSPPPAAVGGVILPGYDATPPAWFDDSLETRTWGETAHFLEGYQAVYGFSGSNMAFPRKTLERHGGFDSNFGMVGGRLRMGEEADFFYRLNRAGGRFWYDPAIKVWHWVPPRNMKLGYRLHRSFRSGQARARIQQRKVWSTAYLEECLTLPTLAKEVFRSLWSNRGKLSPVAVRKLVGFTSQVGFLLGGGR